MYLIYQIDKKKLLFDEISWDCYRALLLLMMSITSAWELYCFLCWWDLVWNMVVCPHSSCNFFNGPPCHQISCLSSDDRCQCHQPRRNQDHNTGHLLHHLHHNQPPSLTFKLEQTLRTSYNIISYLVLSLEADCSFVHDTVQPSLTDWLLDWRR